MPATLLDSPEGEETASLLALNHRPSKGPAGHIPTTGATGHRDPGPGSEARIALPKASRWGRERRCRVR